MIGDGLYAPPVARLAIAGGLLPKQPLAVHVLDVSVHAGAAIGSAVIGLPSDYATGFGTTPQLGQRATLAVGNQLIFSGFICDVGQEIDPRTDEYTLTAACDKMGLLRCTVGQIGIGTVVGGAYGFKDVGFNLTLNPGGRPNKHPTQYDFCTGPSAVYWDLRSAMIWLFTNYAAGAATLNPALLSAAYDARPNGLNLVGKKCLQAIDAVAALAGESWGLTPGAGAGAFAPVRRAAASVRTARMFQPLAGATVAGAGQYHADHVRTGINVADVEDVYQAVSAPIVVESTYSNKGDAPLLTRLTGFSESQYSAMWRADVTQYAANGLGVALSAGARTLEWESGLVTRLAAGGSAYVTAAQMSATPALAANDRVHEPKLWVSIPGTEALAQLCVSGYKIDAQNATVALEWTVGLMGVDGMTHEVGIFHPETLGIWLTVATRLPYPQCVATDAAERFLAAAYTRVITKSDLVPERRYQVWLPDLTASNPNTVVKVATGAVELYHDVTDRLQAVVNAARAGAMAGRQPVSAEFPFFPALAIGDRLTVAGRGVLASGNEVITELVYRFVEGVPDRVVATAANVTVDVDPEAFIPQ